MGSSISSKRNVKMKMDAVDASLLVLNTMSAFLIVGIGKFDLFGVDFAATLFSPAGFGLSTDGGVIGYAAITTTILTNDNAELSSLGNDIKNLGSYYMIAAAATLLPPIAFIVSPLIPSAHFSNRLISGVWSTSLSPLRDRLLWGGCYNGVCFDGEDTIAGILWILVSLGAINWGLVEFVDLDP